MLDSSPMSLQKIPGSRLHGPVGSALRVVLGCGSIENDPFAWDSAHTWLYRSPAGCAPPQSSFQILPLIWTMSWDSRFHTVCLGSDGTYVPK